MVFFQQVFILLSFDDLRHEPEAQNPMDRHLRVFLAFSVPLEPSLFFLFNEVLVHGRKVSFLIVDGLQADVFHEPDQTVHDSSHFAQLF